jgi:hypothetical protein
VTEANKYRSMAQRMREQADGMADRTIREQFIRVAERYEELAQQVEATILRPD